jgi:hypothetical protein
MIKFLTRLRDWLDAACLATREERRRIEKAEHPRFVGTVLMQVNSRGEIVLRQKWSRSQGEARLANISPCLIGMEACVGAHRRVLA